MINHHTHSSLFRPAIIPVLSSRQNNRWLHHLSSTCAMFEEYCHIPSLLPLPLLPAPQPPRIVKTIFLLSIDHFHRHPEIKPQSHQVTSKTPAPCTLPRTRLLVVQASEQCIVVVQAALIDFSVSTVVCFWNTRTYCHSRGILEAS